jgi:WD40 repeat protein
MTAGKLLHTLHLDSPVTSIAFNPSEFVIASGTASSIFVHDLSTFDTISNISVQSDLMDFHPDGNSILNIRKDGLDLLEWEPLKPLQTVAVAWNNVRDIHAIPDTEKLVAGSVNGNFVEIWGIKLGEVLLLTRTRPVVQKRGQMQVSYQSP